MIGRISSSLTLILAGSLFVALPPSVSFTEESERTIPIVFAVDDTVRSEPVWRVNI